MWILIETCHLFCFFFFVFFDILKSVSISVVCENAVSLFSWEAPERF